MKRITKDLPSPRESAEKTNEFRSALKNWQLKVRDCGLLPECERVKRAEDLGITLYEMAQDEKHYDLQSYLDASEFALRAKLGQVPALLKMLVPAAVSNTPP